MSEENHETNEYLNKVIAYRASMSMVKELFEKEVFYVVFLDKNHQFAPCKKKHT